MSRFCSYYQAHIPRSAVLFVVATLKAYEHSCFDRALDPAASRFEFFVPPAYEQDFLKIMEFFKKKGMIERLQKLPNRLGKGGGEHEV